MGREIDLAASFFAGDSPVDRASARRCGLPFYVVSLEQSLWNIVNRLEEEAL